MQDPALPRFVHAQRPHWSERSPERVIVHPEPSPQAHPRLKLPRAGVRGAAQTKHVPVRGEAYVGTSQCELEGGARLGRPRVDRANAPGRARSDGSPVLDSCGDVCDSPCQRVDHQHTHVHTAPRGRCAGCGELPQPRGVDVRLDWPDAVFDRRHGPATQTGAIKRHEIGLHQGVRVQPNEAPHLRNEGGHVSDCPRINVRLSFHQFDSSLHLVQRSLRNQPLGSALETGANGLRAASRVSV
eukprot:scaffold4039_cov124-Isochrysis_galbana.AAC.6